MKSTKQLIQNKFFNETRNYKIQCWQHSIGYALERLGVQAEVTDDAEKIRSADKVIFPGVGEASSAMRSLKQNNLDKAIKELKQPVLGICVGMQLLCEHSEENDTACLGIVPVKV